MNSEHGTLETLDDGLARLTFVRDLPHPQDKVWRAITEPDHLKAWFPSAINGERAAGAALEFVFPFPDAPVMTGTMLAYDPPNVMELEWGDDVLRFELAPIDGGTRLTLTDTFGEYAKSARDAGGWHACLDNLAHEIAGTTPDYNPDDHWRDVSPWYFANFPKDATTAPIPDFHPDAEAMNDELKLS